MPANPQCPFLITLSPAKRFHEIKAATATASSSSFTLPHFMPQADTLAADLQKLSANDISQLMDISDAIATLNHQRYQDYQPLQHTAYPAGYLFAGDAYKTLDMASFSDEAINRCQTSLFILSGLYGLLRPLDLIQPYRLEMGSRTKSYLGSDLYAYWGNQLADHVNQHASKYALTHHINLASSEYAKALPKHAIDIPTIDIVFGEPKGQDFKVVGIKAKKARGLMTRYILTQPCKTLEDIRAFSDGYSLSTHHSTSTRLVFIATA